ALPAAEDAFADIGLYIYGSRVKIDRALLRPQQVTMAAARRLPPAMVPGSVQILDCLPVTANGKVDREALLGLVPQTGTVECADADDTRDDLERGLAALWAQVLGRPAVGRSQGLYDLGGDSLLASQLAGALIEEIPEAGKMSFNELLRVLLEGP